MVENSIAPQAPVLDYSPPARKRISPILLWGGMLLPSLFMQFILMPCLCGDNDIKLEFAAGLDAMFVLRWLIALCTRERSKAWLIYGIIILSSSFWIEPLLQSPVTAHLYGFIGIHSRYQYHGP